MAITSSVSDDNRTVTIHLDHRFDFSEQDSFRHAYESVPATGASITVDMRKTQYMDSSALGMLLIMREYAGGDRSEVRLINVSDDIHSILKIANFDKLLTIEP